ncbi:CHASE2 domain-containing protein [Uliginosibacterium sp. 31-16]|uniref:CHASE2 domain-containing protein n=1 Tax=Uliginosibacterium sp. 31-16 TaxID=3068315 RepID=UPI00273E2ADE|nr:CHASE2 domain-containing protein [Uliginosibacterium sp. 31-16]MDP5240037.1 CHASE2 domain-containing protein [Uliginosibacterium sp. 31-16]
MPETSDTSPAFAESGLWWTKRLPLYATGLCLTLFVALLSILQPRLVQMADLFVYDQLATRRATPPQSDVPVLVEIDEESLAAFGQWPWPRYRLAMLVERLQGLGAKVIALDFLMPEPDRTSPEVIQQERQRDLLTAATPQTSTQDSNSQRLANAIAKGNTVLGYYLDFSRPTPGNRAPPAAPAGMVLIRSANAGDTLIKPQGAIRSLPILTEAASAEGFTNAQEDIDGTFRRTPLLLQMNGDALPSLAMSALLLASPQRHLRQIRNPSETALYWGERRIPTDAAGNLLVDFRSARHRTLSALMILNGTQPPGSLEGKIVLVGAAAKGLGDLHLNPFGQSIYGLEVHATIIDNILAGTFLARPDWANAAELFLILLAGLLATLLLSRAGFVLSLLALGAGIVGLYWGAGQLLIVRGLHLSPLLPILVLILTTSILSLLKYGIEARKLRLRTQDLFEAQDEIIVSMSVLAEARDKETGGHIRRTQRYVEILARQLATTPDYRQLTESDIELLAKSAPLHDIGKVGIPDRILQKPGKLDADEYKLMQTHPLIGATAISRIVADSGHPEKQAFLNYARQMIESHHERWDGHGYPHQLQKKDIPLAGRLMALADVYDALISQRTYKKAMTHAEVCEFITQQSGTQFDPDLVAAFQARNQEFLKAAQTFADPPACSDQ